MTKTANKTAHTPGPWKFRNENGQEGTFNIQTVLGGEILALIDRGWTRDDEHEANARLSAASPDLLEACKAVLETMNTDDMADADQLCRAAIAKATTPKGDVS